MGWVDFEPYEEFKHLYIYLPVGSKAPPGYKFFMTVMRKNGIVSGVEKIPTSEHKYKADRRVPDEDTREEMDCFIKV